MKILQLKTDDLVKLGPSMAVDFFRRLLWSESTRTGIGRNLVNVPDCINVGDGGLDALIPNVSPNFADVIPIGTSGYQIKSADLGPKACKKELHECESIENPLKPGIKRLLEKNGIYVLVLFADLTIEQQEDRRGAVIEELTRCGYNDLEDKVRLYSTNHLMSFADRFPALVRVLKPEAGVIFTYDEWSKFADIKFPANYVLDDKRKKFVEILSTTLKNSRTASSIFRIIGLPGLGKTRLVFEGLKDPVLSNQVLYVKADSIKFTPLLTYLVTNDDLTGIIVIDECSLFDHEYFVNYFAGVGPRLNLITISHEIADCLPPAKQFALSKLSSEMIFELIKEEIPGLPPEIIERLVTFCDGYPKIAAFLLESFRSDPTQRFVFPNLTDTALIDKLLYSNSQAQRSDVKKVLMGISLFDGVGHSGESIDESRWLSEFVGVNWTDFELIVNDQKKRGIIQGDFRIYVTPFPLKIYLINEWWKIYGNDDSLVDKIFGEMPSEFRQSMSSRFVSNLGHAMSVKSGKELVSSLLNKNGIFSNINFLTSSWGSRLFLSLVDADPKASLECLSKNIGVWDIDRISKIESYALLPLVESLQKIAVRRDLFIPASELLLKLAALDNEYYENQIREKFADMFLPAPMIGSYESSPSERIPVLKKAIRSENFKVRDLSLAAFRKALQTSHFTIIRTDFDRNPSYLPKIWNYQSKDEVVSYYVSTWKFLSNELSDSIYDIKNQLSKILLDSAREIVRLDKNTGCEVLSTLSTMSTLHWIDKGELLERVLDILRYEKDHISLELFRAFDELRIQLEGSGFHNKLIRFVKNDFLHDYFHQDAKKASDKWIDEKLTELSTHVLNNPSLLDPEYDWLSSDDAKRAYKFGHVLGKNDTEFSLLPRLLSMHKSLGKENINTSFLGGYLEALYEVNSEYWQRTIKSLSEDDFFRKFIPSLVYLSGMTDGAGRMVLSTIKQGFSNENEFFRFRFGGVINRISEPVFQEWIDYLSTSPSDNLVSLSTEFVYFYYIFRDSRVLPKHLILKMLLHPLFWVNPNKREKNMIPTEFWSKIAIRLAEQYPETLKILSDKLLEHFGDDHSIASGDEEGIGHLLRIAILKNRNEATAKILDQLGPPIDSKAFKLLSWFRGDFLFKEFPLSSIIALDVLWDWINRKKQERALHIARFVPPELFHAQNRYCIAREFLVRFGSDEEVRKAFVSNYFTETFVGSAIDHYNSKKQRLMKLQERESNVNVLNIIKVCLENLDNDIAFSQSME